MSLNTIYAYPFVAFATFELPEAFKEGGMKLVWLKVSGWGDDFKLKMDKFAEEVSQEEETRRDCSIDA